MDNKHEKKMVLASIEKAIVDNSADLLRAQADINKIEAAHPSLFVSGWRPWIGWVCGAGLTYYVSFPFLSWIVDIIRFRMWVALPAIDIEVILTLLTGMLGLSIGRTVEKLKGVARSNIPESLKPPKKKWWRRK